MGFQKCRLVNEFLIGTDIVLMCMSACECVCVGVCICVCVRFTCMHEEMQMRSTELMHVTNRVRRTKSGYEFSPDLLLGGYQVRQSPFGSAATLICLHYHFSYLLNIRKKEMAVAMS